MNTNELFETEKFNRINLVKQDLHRTAQKTRWVSPKGFNVTTKHEDLCATQRHSIMKDGFQQQPANGFSFRQEIYEDPSIDPGFVRTTKGYLKQSL